MEHVDTQEMDETRAERTAPQPAPAQLQSMQMSPLAWASAVGNQAVQRIARQHDGPAEQAEEGEAVVQPPVEEAAPAPEEEAPDALPAAEAESLAALGDDAETLPE